MARRLNRDLSIALLSSLFLAHIAIAQDWTLWEGARQAPRLRAQLRDKDQNARNHMAAVEVEVQNVWLNYPNPAPQQGIQSAVLEYKLDNCSPILTTDSRLSFERLSSGEHAISVVLVGKDNRAISPPARLQVSIP